MSFIQDTVQCPHCKKYMNVAFGIVGTTQVAGWPKECSFCRRKEKFVKVRAGWAANEHGELV